jgi:RNA polymerase sigma factor (sigma-70 family)
LKAEATDAELVAAIRGGDPAAWGDVFDRHRDAVWRVAIAVTRNSADAEDTLSSAFLRAVESIHQLEQPERLRPWLLSITRRGALDRVRPSRRRERPSEALEDLTALGDVAGDGDDLSDELASEERVELVRDALLGLDERDRIALELSMDDDLSGAELAEVLEVTRDNAYALVHNARERFALSVASLVVARRGRELCTELDQLLGRWDGRLDPLIRKRVARHIRSCETCEATSQRSVSPSALLAAVPLLFAPAALADRVRAETLTAANASATTPLAGSAAAGSGGLTAKVAAALAAVVLTGAGVGLWTVTRTDTSAATAPATGVNPSTTVSPITVSPTTVAARIDPCDAVTELQAFASSGPAAPSGEAVLSYLSGALERLEAVVAALGPDATEELLAYTAAYTDLVDSGVSDLVAIADGPELRALADTVETQLAEHC